MISKTRLIELSTQTGTYDFSAAATFVGPDLLVWIYGGEAPHIGAVAMAQPRPSLADSEKISATASVFTYVGHKEDELAKKAALSLSSQLETKVVVTAGIHWDNLDEVGITKVMENFKLLLKLLLEVLKQV